MKIILTTDRAKQIIRDGLLEATGLAAESVEFVEVYSDRSGQGEAAVTHIEIIIKDPVA